MANPYSGEWIKINTIANDVRALQDRIAELQNAAAQLQADINSVPEVTDEEGNDVNAEQRNALNAQLESVKASIDEANGQRERLGSQARALARQYQTEARAYEEKAHHTSNATAVFNNISNYRFGARMASANAQVTKQREQHYQSYVNILNALVIAAQNAANGITPSGSEQSVADRGTFHNSHSTSGGAHKSGEKGNRQNYQRGWNGIPGESQKIADQNESKALLNNLGVEGIPYKNGQPDFSTVAHAAVPTDDSAALLTCADAMLAAKYGVSADEIAAYRKENGLEWRGNENGEATLIPQCIGDEYLEGRVENQEKSAKDALTAYMWAHNYGKEDASIYMKDPEWKRLHKAAFPDYIPNYRAMIKEGILSGKFSDLIEYTDYKEKPKTVDRRAFNEQVRETGVICFRTFNKGEDGTSAKKYKERLSTDSAKDFRHNGTGKMVYGEGIYLTINRFAEKGVFPEESVIKATRDESLRYGEEGTRATACVTIASDANIGDSEVLRREFKKLTLEEQLKYYTPDPRIPSSASGIASFAIACGYDGVIWKEAGMGCDYLTMYNRKKLVVLDDPENVAFGIN